MRFAPPRALIRRATSDFFHGAGAGTRAGWRRVFRTPRAANPAAPVAPRDRLPTSASVTQSSSRRTSPVAGLADTILRVAI